jgi:hypothetical protein
MKGGTMISIKSSSEIQLIFILCKLSYFQIKYRLNGEGILKLLNSLEWKISSAKNKHELLKIQYEKDFETASKDQQLLMEKIRKIIETQLAS